MERRASCERLTHVGTAGSGAARLERFITAQNQLQGGFESALAELNAGGKQGHWIWYVLPQLAGLGASSMSRVYGIDGAAEAVEYLKHPLLRARLLQVTTAVAEGMKSGIALETLMGSSIDAMKLVSSLTLFSAIGKRLSPEASELREFRRVAEEVLEAAGKEGYPPCRYTLSRLE